MEDSRPTQEISSRTPSLQDFGEEVRPLLGQPELPATCILRDSQVQEGGQPPLLAGMVSLSPGEKFDDRATQLMVLGPASHEVPGYEMLKELGRGGMGVVYLARDRELHRLVALKMLLSGLFAGPAEVARFRRETQAVAQLQHPAIVQLYEVGEHEGIPYCVFEYIDSGSLNRLLRGLPQPPRDAAAFAIELAEGLHAAHLKNIVHRDLKPANILLRKKTEAGSSVAQDKSLAEARADWPQALSGVRLSEFSPKVTDFGLAKWLTGDQEQTRTGEIVGTPSYMAPEQAEGRSRDAGQAADVYSLGAILYEMLTGRPPYQGRDFLDTIVQVRTLEIVSPRRLVPNLPRDLETICLKCLAKQPHRRYVSAQALAEDLRRFLHGEPIVARPVGRTERLWRWCQRNPLVASLSAALGLLLFAGLLAGWWLAVWALEEKQRADELAEAATARAREAEANFQLAKQAVDDCYLMARDNPLFQQEANWQARRLLLEKALPFYENFRFQRANDPEILATLADNYRKIGFILHELGRKKEALHAYAQARAVLLRLEELRPQPDQVFGLVQIWQACGNLHREMGERKEAGEAFATAQQLLERLQQNTPTDARYAFELAAVQHNQGLLALDAGQYKEALNTFVHVQQLLRQLPSKGTPLAQRKRLLAATLMHLGTLHRQQRQLVTAQEEVLEAKRLWQELVTAYPQATSYEAELGMACNNLGNVYQDQKKITRAVPEYLQAKAIHEKLLARLPVTVDRQRDLAMTCSNLALAFKDLGRHEEALEHFQQALRTWERLHKEHPETAYYPFALAATHNNLGLLQHRLGEESDAEQSYRLAITLGEKVRTKQPHNGEVASQLALWYCNLARQHLDLKNFPDALQEYDRAQELYGWLAQRNAHVPLFTVQQCQALLAKGHLHRLLQEEAEAFRCYGDIIRRLGVLLARKETAANLERTWQQACIAQAELHLLHGSYQEALQDLLRLKMPR